MNETFNVGDVGKVVGVLLGRDVKSATKYVSPTCVIRATRTLYGKKIDKRATISIVLKIGRPNKLERAFIKDCKEAGEPFPVKNIQLKFPPKPKKKG